MGCVQERQCKSNIHMPHPCTFREIAYRLGMHALSLILSEQWTCIQTHHMYGCVCGCGMCMDVGHGCTHHPYYTLSPYFFTNSSLHFKMCLCVYFLMAFGQLIWIQCCMLPPASTLTSQHLHSFVYIFDILLQVHSQNQRGQSQKVAVTLWAVVKSRSGCSMRAEPLRGCLQLHSAIQWRACMAMAAGKGTALVPVLTGAMVPRPKHLNLMRPLSTIAWLLAYLSTCKL